MNYRKINNATGWVVAAIACTVYLLTAEPTGSFWDCGEFVSSCYKLQIPHPPGAPLFLLMGRLFIILFGDKPMLAARAVNSMSALASGFTILFLFWSITHFAKKIVVRSAGSPTGGQIFSIMSAGVVGALAYTFSDSFWYSAVEGEVYATSALFTSVVFWAILKWEEKADEPGADRWLIFICYMIGLSIGVHLLSLLTIPAIVMVYYFKKYRTTRSGTLWAILAGCVLTGLVLKIVIQYTIKGAGWMDIRFVNDLGLPFFSGFAFFFLLLGLLIGWGIRYSARRKRQLAYLGLWGFAFMILGYSTYFTTMIRSNADPGVDVFNVDNPVTLVGYLSRDQYEDWPILYGPDFTDTPPQTDGEDLYVKGKDKYELAGKKLAQDWSHTPSSHFFPRMWNSSNARGEIDMYRNFTGLAEGDQPTMADNIKFFLRYQTGWMYMRYFMWNFAGKQNDLQGFGNPRDSNWISGIPVLDNAMYGNQSKLPSSVRTNNKSYNRLFLLPLLLGLGGMIFQYVRQRKDFLVNLLLFLLTGLAIVAYLNQTGYQPRERDYAYAGSFYAFAIWIGLGTLWVKELLEKSLPSRLANASAALVCLITVPLLMAGQEWDDHDRSRKTLARDMAKDYLESCPPNAILFTGEDNDTYPLWYAQEVEGIRPDVRIAITSLLSGDWYINQMRYKINQSNPVDVIFTPEQIAGDRREVVLFSEGSLPGYDTKKYYDLYGVLKDVIGSDDPRYQVQTTEGEPYHYFPGRKFTVPVDKETVLSNGTVRPGDPVVPAIQLDITGQRYLVKNDLAILSVIAANKWKRPICFANEQDPAKLGLSKYLRSRGMVYQLVPVEDAKTDDEASFRTIMGKFEYGHAGTKGVYLDEENRRRLNNIKLAIVNAALGLSVDGHPEMARQVLEQFDKNVSEENFPYGMTTNLGNRHDVISAQFLQACYQAQDAALAAKVSRSLRRDLKEQMSYYRSLGEETWTDAMLAREAYQFLQGKPSQLSEQQSVFAPDIFSSFQLLQQLDVWEKKSLDNDHLRKQ